MIKKIVKKILLNTGLLPYVIEFKAKAFPGKLEKVQAIKIKAYTAFYGSFIQKGDLAFDIGAHRGSRLKSLLDCGAKAVAIEPYWPCIQYMKVKFGNKATILHKGVGPVVEMKELYISEDPTTNSFSNDWIDKVKENRFAGRNWHEKRMVEMTTIDTLIREYGLPKFCKIDVEGFEYEVLKGMTRSIPVISFEYTVPEHTSDALRCIDRLSEIDPNYKFNYSQGETTSFALSDFLSNTDFKKIMGEEIFMKSNCGDIYAVSFPFKITK